MKKKDKSIKKLLIILIVLIVAVIALILWNYKNQNHNDNPNTNNSNTTGASNTNENNSTNNSIENNTTIENNTINNTTTPDSTSTKNIYENMNDEEIAIQVAKNEWGTGEGVYYTINSKKTDNIYIVAVCNSKTTEVLEWYTVNIKTKSIEK